MQRALKKRLIKLATAPFRAVGVIHYYWGRGKLGGDPIFAALIDEHTVLEGVVDVERHLHARVEVELRDREHLHALLTALEAESDVAQVARIRDPSAHVT